MLLSCDFDAIEPPLRILASHRPQIDDVQYASAEQRGGVGRKFGGVAVHPAEGAGGGGAATARIFSLPPAEEDGGRLSSCVP